jgi:hypothetical protein
VDQKTSNNRPVTKKRVLIFLLFQLIVGVVLFIPGRRLDAIAHRPFSETVVFIFDRLDNHYGLVSW